MAAALGSAWEDKPCLKSCPSVCLFSCLSVRCARLYSHVQTLSLTIWNQTVLQLWLQSYILLFHIESIYITYISATEKSFTSSDLASERLATSKANNKSETRATVPLFNAKTHTHTHTHTHGSDVNDIVYARCWLYFKLKLRWISRHIDGNVTKFKVLL